MKDIYGKEVPEDAMIIRETEEPMFRQCRRKWFLSSHNGLNYEPLTADMRLSFGSCMHAGWAAHFMQDPPVAAFHIEFDHVMGNMKQVMGEGFFEEGLQLELCEYKTLGETLLNMYEEWCEGDHCVPKDSQIDIVTVEHRILVPVPGMRKVWLAVKHDAWGYVDKLVWSIENKTTSGSVVSPGHLTLDLQMSYQLWALWKELEVVLGPDNVKIGGALYNMARKQMPGPKVKAPIFGRHQVHRSPKELNYHIEQLATSVREMRRVRNSTPVWQSPLSLSMLAYPNPMIFQNGYCNWGCDFFRVCEGVNRGEDWEYLLKANYRVRTKSIFQVMEEEMAG